MFHNLFIWQVYIFEWRPPFFFASRPFGHEKNINIRCWRQNTAVQSHTSINMKNLKWAKTGHMKVTAESWLLMWTQGKALLHSNPTQVAKMSQWEHLAKQAALLVASRSEVQAAEAATILQQVVDDWLNGSASVASELNAAIFAQTDSWAIVDLEHYWLHMRGL